MKFNIRDICLISVFTAIIAVCAQIYVPMLAGVPFTMQTFAVSLAGVILGAKRGTLSALVYIILGMIGIPVFNGFTGGFAFVFGRTGGFILSFPVMALCAGIFSDMGLNKKLPVKYLLTAAGLVFGTAINYISGLLMFSVIMSRNLHTAFIACVMPFILPDIIKMILAGIIGVSVRKILTKNRILTQ